MEIKWQPIFTAKTPTLFQWYIFEGEKEKYFKDVLNLDTAYTNGKNVLDEIFYDLNEMIGMEVRLSSEIKSDHNFIEKYIRVCYQKCDFLIKISKKLGKIKNLDKLGTRNLLSLYKQYQKAVFEIMPFMTTPMIIDRILKKKIVGLLESDLNIKNKIEQDLLLSKLIIPIKKNYFVKEQDNLLRMAIKLQKNKNINVNQDIEKHLGQYAWTSTNVYLGTLQTKKDVINKLQSLLKKNPKGLFTKKKKNKEKVLKDYKNTFNLVKKSNEMGNLINLARQFLFLQTHKMEVLYLAHYYALPFLKEIGDRFRISVDELIYLTGDEIIRLLKGTIHLDKVELNKRMKSVSIIKERNKITLFSGDKIRKIIQKTTKAVMVRGTVASRGKAIGKAKLLFEVEDMKKIKKGDIIVSPMTRPHFVPVMKKSAGIITDFGGMLCHAALISREFNIPCIVGTEKATKVFKDNDLIELNAYEGVARKI